MFSQAQTNRSQMVVEVKKPNVAVQKQDVGVKVPSQQTVQSSVATIERVDPSKLWDAWQKYMYTIKESNGQLYGSMGAGPQLSADGITVEIRIASEYERSNIETNVDLVSYLRKGTENNNLRIRAVVDPKIAKEREVVYTATQKFEKMREANSYLDTFMKNLGLIVE